MRNRATFMLVNLLITVHVFSADFKSYSGRKGNKLALVQVSDSIAYVEYCYTNFRNLNFTKFDTLKLVQDKYIGKFSEIRVKNNNLLFRPGGIILKKELPDTSFNKMRNLGYLQYTNARYEVALKWTKAKLNELNASRWTQISNINPDEYKNTIRNTYDSLFNYYSSKGYVQNFNKVMIRNCRLFPKKYLESTENTEIERIWKLLSTGIPKKNNIIPFIVQYPISALPLAVFDLDVAIVSTPFTYTALIWTEKFIINRLHAGSTYKIICISNNEKIKSCMVIVRKSKILGNYYSYMLPSNFEKEILRK